LQEATNEEEIRKARAARYESVFLRAAKPLMESKAELEALSREGVLHWTAVRSLKRNLEVLYELLDMVDDTLKTVESPI
jgi:hypothetical protein